MGKYPMRASYNGPQTDVWSDMARGIQPDAVAAHARATVEAEGAETWPEGLVEAVPLAILNSDRVRNQWFAVDGLSHLRDEDAAVYRLNATAALSAIRAWEGRE